MLLETNALEEANLFSKNDVVSKVTLDCSMCGSVNMSVSI